MIVFRKLTIFTAEPPERDVTVFRKLTMFTTGSPGEPPMERTRCLGCSGIYFVCDENRRFTCERCDRVFHVKAESEIDNMYKLTVYLNENEPIIGPAILERLSREGR